MIESHWAIGFITWGLAIVLAQAAWRDSPWLSELRLSRWLEAAGGPAARRWGWSFVALLLVAAGIWIFVRGSVTLA